MNDIEDRPVEVITLRVEPELALFQVQIEGCFSHPSEPGKPGFGETPEALDAVDVGLPLDVACIEERLVDFDLPGERELLLGVLGQSFADRLQETIHSLAVQVGQFGNLGGLQIERVELHQLAEYGL